ncbi:hypothetical protein [Halorussus sp. AFM4]|uniref:hypothetical protein n=1 Tax=Halorussus sp. AFM4 TaxID=3421651 RepID=UPI003EBE6045
MKSLRRGLWDGEVGKDARGRFSCRICHRVLVAVGDGEDDEGSDAGERVGRSVREEDVAGATGETGVARSCPECGRTWESRATAPWRTTGG